MTAFVPLTSYPWPYVHLTDLVRLQQPSLLIGIWNISHLEFPSDPTGSVSADPNHQLEAAIRNGQYDELKSLLRSRDDLLETSLQYELEENESIEILTSRHWL